MFVKTIPAAAVLNAIEAGQPPIIVDIRDEASFASGHIPGALSSTVESLDANAFSAVPRETPIVVTCYRGVMSRRAVRYLESAGFFDVASLRGGMNAWLKLPNAPVER